MVIAICGTATLKDLGESVIVASKRCTVETYLTFGPSTQCNFCQRYGHPSQRCPFEKDKHLPTCAICAGSHLTEVHTCTVDKEYYAHALQLNVLPVMHLTKQPAQNVQHVRRSNKLNGRSQSPLKGLKVRPERHSRPIKE
jgi:hypothetical protein